jgi:putative hydrolase of the HAD superfamily
VSYAAVFFDAGETLVHPHPSFAELFADVLRREGRDVSADVVADKVALVAERFQRAARENELWTTSPERSRAFWVSVYEAFLAELGLPPDEALLAVLHEEFTNLANYALFEDVLPVLQRLRDDGLTLGVVSNFEEWLERLLEELRVASFFDVQVISGVEGFEKPDPRIFRVALERAGVTADESAYVGDNPVFDVEPAAELGMFPVLIDRRGRYPNFPTARITSMAQLPRALGLSTNGGPRRRPAS